MATAAPKTMVPGYRHVPGHHCGSTALRNLFGFHGAEISEELTFGLGAGACFYYLTLPEASPTRWFNGRAARLEENFRDLTGGAVELHTFDTPGEAWAAARWEVDAGRPALLLTDLYYLEHYGRSAHFPGHAVVLAGYDDGVAYLSDTAFAQLQETSLRSLAEARHGDHPVFRLEGHMFTISGEADEASLRAAVPAAVARAAAEMVEPEWAEFAGLPAVAKLAEEAGEWPETAEDWRWCARFAYQVIERRGTGGGNFRLMYSRFLAETGYPQAPLAADAAARWTGLAEAFRAASEPEDPDPALWREVASAAAACRDAEERLWTELAAATADAGG
jgi:Butirosin biosynthesis protein H, N-terminal/Domain of unknown function (DUF4872)